MELIKLCLPALAVAFFIGWKLPPRYKTAFFKCPVWVSSTIIAWKLGHLFTGVMAPYAMVVMDMALMPIFNIIKWDHERGHEGRTELATAFWRALYSATNPAFTDNRVYAAMHSSS